MTPDARLPAVLAAFDFGSPVADAPRYGQGHINDTFCVHTEAKGRFILQRISPAAFKKPAEVMSNILKVTDYLRQKAEALGEDPSRAALEFLRTRDGRFWYEDAEGAFWRSYPFVAGTICKDSATTPAEFAASGRAFGRFQWMLSDFPASQLYETIPHFHDTEDRLRVFKEALKADKLGRAHSCEGETAFILEREADCSVALEAQRRGVLPTRVTHNDTKINNVILDEATGEGVCIIDLDTVMPGLAINDFGDSIRFGANHCAEDEPDTSKMWLDLELFQLYAKAFLEGAHGGLTPAEVDYLPWGAKLMTLECGIRFLTDYLLGDEYFHITRPRQNLERARTQLALVADMERRWDEMGNIISRCR